MIDENLATFHAALSVAIGAAIAYISYISTVAARFVGINELSAFDKIRYWIGVASCLIIFTGAEAVANELLWAHLYGGGPIRGNNIYKGAILVIPALIGLALSCAGRGNSKSDPEISEITNKIDAHKAPRPKTPPSREPPGIDLNLDGAHFQKAHGINNYDYAKAINEYGGVLPDLKIDASLLDHCRNTTSSKVAAQNKYVKIRAYEISRSIDRDEPHRITSSAGAPEGTAPIHVANTNTSMGAQPAPPSFSYEVGRNIASKGVGSRAFWETSFLLTILGASIIYSLDKENKTDAQYTPENKVPVDSGGAAGPTSTDAAPVLPISPLTNAEATSAPLPTELRTKNKYLPPSEPATTYSQQENAPEHKTENSSPQLDETELTAKQMWDLEEEAQYHGHNPATRKRLGLPPKDIGWKGK
jgi:hypothetical protein